MADRSTSYDRFGPFILFKRIERDSLSDLWRAGRISGASIDEFFAVRRFNGGDQQALLRSVKHAASLASVVAGSAVVRQQIFDHVDGTPFVAWEYSGGRSLSHILESAKGNSTNPPNPIPIDQCLAITEKIAFSLEATGNMKQDGQRLTHGGLLPQFTWISEDGDIRVAGQAMSDGLIASLRHPAITQELGGYFAPEIRSNRTTTPSSEVYSIGAVLFALVTGNPPPDPLTASAFDSAVKGATVMVTGDGVPADIRAIIDRSLTLDPASRYPGPGAIREAVASLTHGERYSPTTFNLAFYIHNLLREEMEEENQARGFENRIDVTPFLKPPEPPKPRVAEVPASFREAEAGQAEQKPAKSRLPLIAVIVVLLIAAGASGYYFMFMRSPGAEQQAPTEQVAAAQPQPIQPAVVSEPLVSALPDAGGEPEEVVQEDTPESDEAARQKLIEEEINRRLQAEMMKLQADYDRKLRAAENRGQEPAPAARVDGDKTKEALSPAEKLDQAKLSDKASTTAAGPETKQAATPEQKQAAPADTTPQTQVVPPPAAAPPKPSVHEGDLIGIADVDTAPKLLKAAPPTYPPLAARQRAEATIILSALVSEAGSVVDVKILRGDSRRLGFDEAAIDAVKRSIYEPATKDGKKVRTWLPVPVIFKPTR